MLRLWVPGSLAPAISIEPDQPGTPHVVRGHDDGFLATVRIGPRSTALVVQTPGAEPWRIALEPMPSAPALEQLWDEAARAADAATLERLLPRTDALADALPDERRVDALRLRMLLDHQLGHADAALQHGELALDVALRSGRVGAAIEIAQVLAYERLRRGDDAAARWLVDLQSLHAPLDLDASRRAGWHYYRGILACHLGDLRTGLLAFEAAERTARRIGDGPQELSAAAQRVILLGALGRSREQGEGIARVLEIVDGHDPPRCEDAKELDNVAWALLSDHGTAPAPREVDALFDRAERILVGGERCNASRVPSHRGILADVALGRGLAALGRDDTRAAKAELDRVVVDDLFPPMPPWFHYARGMLALREGRIADAEAAASSATKAALAPGAAAGPDPRLPWRLALLRGQVHARSGRGDAALTAFLDAERLVDRLVGSVGIDQGRESLAAQAQEGAAQAIDLLLARGRIDDAAGVARRSRGRTFRPIGAARATQLAGPLRERFAEELDAYRRSSDRIGEDLRDAWRLDRATRDALLREHAQTRVDMRRHLQAAYALLDGPDAAGDEMLAVPAPGEVWLLFHPRAAGLAAFALTSEGTRTQTLAGMPDAEAVTQLLSRFDEELEVASSVLVMPVGPLLDIDFAALPWRGDALLASRAVGWKLDVARASGDPDVVGRRALVVGDPATRLPGLGRLADAAAEADAVAMALRDLGFSVDLRTGEAATFSDVLSSLAEVELLHWAGHGRRGDDAWDSRLPLAGEATLDLGHVLALGSVPSTVVLTGCETGKTDRDAAAGGLHLAAGFVVAGSRLVVAANTEVDDALARAFGTALYGPDAGMPDAGIEAVRRAALALRQGGHREWTAFRAWVP